MKKILTAMLVGSAFTVSALTVQANEDKSKDAKKEKKTEKKEEKKEEQPK